MPINGIVYNHITKKSWNIRNITVPVPLGYADVTIEHKLTESRINSLDEQ